MKLLNRIRFSHLAIISVHKELVIVQFLYVNNGWLSKQTLIQNTFFEMRAKLSVQIYFITPLWYAKFELLKVKVGGKIGPRFACFSRRHM